MLSQVGKVLHEKANRYYWSGSGKASIKSFYNGRAEYRLTSGTRFVDSSRYLLLNHHQPYTIEIDSQADVESLCVFFEETTVNRTWLDCSKADSWLVDNPFHTGVDTIEFMDVAHWNDDVVTPKLAHLRKWYPQLKSDPMWLDEKLIELLQSILRVHTEISGRIESMKAVKPSTREELFRRVSMAREVIMENYRSALTLTDLSAVCALSVNHFIDCYKRAYGMTPHQHILSLRLKEAAKLLRNSSLTVLEVCQAVGFDSPSSFSSLFRQRTGSSPSDYRKLSDFR